jgi:predicted TIM-barrel fold metal-dependent hydrolase
MARRLLLAPLALAVALASADDIWTVQMIDPNGDARGRPDAAQLSFRYDRVADVLWFRVAVYGRPDPDAFGIRLAIDTDRIVTAQVTRTNGVYRGTIGVADSAGASAGNLTSLSRDTLQLRVDDDGYIVGVKRTEVTSGTKMTVVASVGTNREWTDEIAGVTIDVAAPRPERGLREIDVTRNNLVLPAGDTPLANDEPPSVERRGRTSGRALILVPGVFSGADAFDPFIERHTSDYRFFIVTPPGLNGTRPRLAPPAGTSFGERTWTRHLERDLLDLIRRERLERPVLVSHGFPGSLAVTAIAANHPEAIGGAIEIAEMPPQPLPSPRDTSGKTLITPEDRVRLQDEFWGPKWFKYVTPETWENNNYRASMFQVDAERGEQVRRRIEQHSLPVKIRYLTESNGTDDSADIARIAVPVLAVRPGFNDTILADPLNRWFRTSFIDAWNAFSTNPAIHVTTIPGSGVRVFHDQLKAADDAIVAFLAQVSAAPPRQAEPILDAHLHALSANGMGPPPVSTCTTPLTFSPRDPREPYNADRFAACDTVLKSPATDDEMLAQTLAIMTRYNVTAIASGPIDVVRRWHAAAPERIIPALMPNSRTTMAAIRTWVGDGTIRVLGELGFQYQGLLPTDDTPDAYFALAEELDIPVGVHVGPGAPGAPYVGYPKYEMRLTNPLLYENALTRHPKLRLYIMHAAWPMLDQIIALLYAHPQVYVDISLIDWYVPRKEFHFFLRRLVEAGFEKRIMFGSDQTIWPDALRIAIEGVESADFLTASQKRDIFYNNAARFLRLPRS